MWGRLKAVLHTKTQNSSELYNEKHEKKLKLF